MEVVREMKEESNGWEQYKNILEDWIPKDASIVIAKDGTYIYCKTSNSHAHHQLKDDVHPDSVAGQVLRNRNKTDILTDETIFGIPYYAMGYLIKYEQQDAALVIILPPSYVPKKQKQYRFLTGKQDEDWIPIPIEQVTHIESLQKRNWFYANDEQYKTNVTLKELQLKLPEYFLRIHRSYIINLFFIKCISRDLTSNFVVELKNGVLLPVSQSYINHLKKVLEF